MKLLVGSRLTFLVLLGLIFNILGVLNVRGSDISFNPVFYSYLVIRKDTIHLFIDASKINQTVLDHFKTEGILVNIHPYENFYVSIFSSNRIQFIKIQELMFGEGYFDPERSKEPVVSQKVPSFTKLYLLK